MIIFDYSQLAYAVVYALKPEILNADEEGIMHIIRCGVLSSIRSKKMKFRANSKDIVIACDGNSYWRYDIFPHYKASRKKSREEDDMPWEVIKRCMDTLIQEFKLVLPYKVIQHNKAEADDVIAIIIEDIVNKTPIQNGLEEDFENVIMLNKDKDCKQLLKYDNVRQFSPYTNEFLKLECSSKEFLRRLILTGDAGDSIPNVFSPTNSFVDGIRQKPATEKKMQPFLEATNMLDVPMDEQTKERLILNTRLISFNAIPKSIRQEVVSMYHECEVGTKMSLYTYMSKKRCDALLERIDEF